jgi:ATP-dependent RNA helicase DeaD
VSERAPAREDESGGRSRRRSRRRPRRDEGGARDEGTGGPRTTAGEERASAGPVDEDAATAEVAMPERSRARDEGARPERDEASDSDFTNGDDDETRADMTRLYINVGRRDGIRAGEINRLLRERCELSRAEIGRIRVRDKHTFVDVLTPRVDGVVAALGGQTVQDRELVVEPARVNR